MTPRCILWSVVLLCALEDATADTRATPLARTEIERIAGPYPGTEFQTLKDIYKKHLAEAGFAVGKVTRDLAYGSDQRHRLDIFQPQALPRDAMPVLVFVHGGAFVRGERSDGDIFDNVLHFFARHGVLGVNTTYRLAPEHRWPAAAEDLAAAIRWVRENAERYGGDPDNVFLMGHSAGAVHVASYAFMETLHPTAGDGVRGAILLSGVYGAETSDGSGHVYYGEEGAQRAPLAFVSGRAIPLYVIDAEYDPVSMQTSALRLIQAVCERDGRCPRHQQIAGHNHYSMTYHINTLDDSIASDILDFVVDLSSRDDP